MAGARLASKSNCCPRLLGEQEMSVDDGGGDVDELAIQTGGDRSTLCEDVSPAQPPVLGLPQSNRRRQWH
jgi:hypothetical protein